MELTKNPSLTERVSYEISREELLRRQNALFDEVKKQGGDHLVIFGPTTIFYLSNFVFLPTERPIILVINSDGHRVLFAPSLEKGHAEGEKAFIDQVIYYPEYPSEIHPMVRFAKSLIELGLEKATIAVDSDGYSSSWGYHGPKLSEVVPEAKIIDCADIIEKLRMIKSAEEIALIRESVRWGNLAQALLQEYSKPGCTENEVKVRASMEAALAMMRTMGSSFKGTEVDTGFNGQIGPNSATHTQSITNATLKMGDNLISHAGSRVFGYRGELDRTMFMGEPNAKQKHFFDLMLQIQDTAFAAIKPGHPCSEVDKAVRNFFEKNNMWAYWHHHVGHGLGLMVHEVPFFDIGDKTIMKPGMVISVEPGVYVEGLGGFRHSDTIVVTETGMDILTYYPRDLASLICG